MRNQLASLTLSLLAVAACGGGKKAATSPSGGKVAAGSIRAIDWNNRTYDNGDAGSITVKDGEAELEIDPEMPDIRGSFSVWPAVYGDVDGDGSEDAIVITAFNGGGSGTFTSGEFFVMRAGATEPVRLGAVPGGDRGDGGLAGIRIEGGKVLVDRYLSTDSDGACCPSKLTKEVWTWNGSAFVEDEAARQTVDNPDFQGE